MAGTTSNLGLYLPGGGSTGAYTPDEAADIDKLNENFVKIDVANGNRQYYGPSASVGTVNGMRVGDRYQESDAGFHTHVFDGVQWVPTLSTAINAGGDYGNAEVVMVSVDLAVVNGRRYRISAQAFGALLGGGPLGIVQVRLKLGAPTTELAMVLSQDVPSGTTVTGHASIIWTASTGSGVGNFQVTVATSPGFVFRSGAGQTAIFVEPCY